SVGLFARDDFRYDRNDDRGGGTSELDERWQAAKGKSSAHCRCSRYNGRGDVRFDPIERLCRIIFWSGGRRQNGTYDISWWDFICDYVIFLSDCRSNIIFIVGYSTGFDHCGKLYYVSVVNY